MYCNTFLYCREGDLRAVVLQYNILYCDLEAAGGWIVLQPGGILYCRGSIVLQYSGVQGVQNCIAIRFSGQQVYCNRAAWLLEKVYCDTL